ncbi:E3 UFM1-protein ligase 1 [Cryptosporidium felis]|nr:E3 UFM1-protein ligase 1 [Cryptosporidium felis]
MDEIEKLERELERIQSRVPEKKILNERTCIEILQKLIKKKNLNLITSQDGEVFYTQKYVLSEICELLKQKGRLSMSEISKTMKISMEIVLRLSKDLEKSKENFVFYKNDILTRDYIDNIFWNVNQELQDLHVMSLLALSQKTDLSIEFIKEEMKQRIGKEESEVKGEIVLESNNNPLLISNTYYKIIQVVLKGALLVTKKPLQINKITGLQLSNDSQIAKNVVKTLMESNWIKGSIFENKLFIPEFFVQNEIGKLRDRFIANGYLEVSQIKEVLQYSYKAAADHKNQQVSEWAKNNLNFGKKVLLLKDQFIIKPSIIEIVRDNIRESCFSPGPGHLYPDHLLPHILTKEADENYHLHLLELINQLENNPPCLRESEWLFVTATYKPELVFSIQNRDSTHFKIDFNFNSDPELEFNQDQLDDQSSQLLTALKQESHKFEVFPSKDHPPLLMFTNLNLIISTELFSKFQNYIIEGLKRAIDKMILPYFHLLPSPNAELKPPASKQDSSNLKTTLDFVNDLIYKRELKSLFLSEFSKEWSDIIHDFPEAQPSHQDSHEPLQPHQDLLWSFLVYSTSPFIVHMFNKRMKYVFHPSNISRTFHVQDEQ